MYGKSNMETYITICKIYSQGEFAVWIRGSASKGVVFTQIETKRKQEWQYSSDKIDFKTKTVKRDKEGHYIMIKGSIKEEDITIINIYAPNIGAPQYVRQMLTSMKGEINSNTIVGDFLIPNSHLWTDQLNRELTKK